MRPSGLFTLALDICLDLYHPMFERYPRLAQCPDVDAVYFELLRYYLAESA